MNATLNTSNLAGREFGARHRAGFLVSGAVLVLCGIFAILAPVLSTLAATLAVGVSAAVAGVTQVVQAFRSSAWKGFFLNLLIGLAFFATGAVFFVWPPKGALAITITLSWLLLVTGVGEVALGFRIRPAKGWPWLILSGLITFAAGVWLMLRIPVTGFFVPGIALGIALLSEGIAFIAIAFGRGGARRSANDTASDRDTGDTSDGTEQPVP